MTSSELLKLAAAALSGLPDSLPMEPYQTVDRGSPHYKAGWNACRRAMLAAAPDVQGEPVGWQYYKYGKWWNGDNLTQDQRENFKKKGVRVRNVYAEPQLAEWTPAPDVAELVEALEACDTALFCDLKTDEEKSTFFLSGRGYETGVIAQAIQNDVAMAYHRCSEYRKELEALQAENALLRAAAPAVQGEPVFMWHRGATDDESEVVDVDCACPCCVPLYATPQPAEHQPDVTLLLSLLEHARCNTCDGSGGFYDNHGQPNQCQWCHDRSEVLAAHRKQGGEA